MGCDSSKLKKKEEPDQQEYFEPKKVTSSPAKNKHTVGRKQRQARGRQPKYRTKIDSRVLTKYDVKALIGRGSFSDVLRVENKLTKQPYAVKILRLKNQHSKEVSQSELRALTRIRHPYVIQLIEVFQSKECVYLVMELATGGELYERIKMKGHLTEKESIRVLQMVLDGVTYLHSKGITHRDLKPENLLFYHPGQDSKILITDFGFAKSVANPEDKSLFTTWCGTPEYIAPELLCKKPYSNSVDIWAIGVITYVMISGHLPFAAETPSKLYRQIVGAKYAYSREVWKHASDGAKDFIDKLLQVDPEKRPKAVEARKEQWVNSVPPLTGHKGHSFKYLSSQVSGKSGKTNVSYTSPVVRQKKVEEEMVSKILEEKDKNLRMMRKDVEIGKDSYEVEGTNNHVEGSCNFTGINGMLNDNITRPNLEHHLKTELHPPVPKDKPESTVTSYQEEFPSAAATEDSNSFASRAEDSPGIEADFIEQEFPAVSPRFEINNMKKSVGDTNAVSHFGDGVDSSNDWMGRQSEEVSKGNLLDLHMSDGRGKTWQNPHKGELDTMFPPLKKNKLKWHMQEKTSVMEKVGMWLEDQNGYYRDERLSNSHGDIYQMEKLNLRSSSFLDNSLMKYSTISASLPPFKKSTVKDRAESLGLHQLKWPEFSRTRTVESSETAREETIVDEIEANRQEDLWKETVHNNDDNYFGNLQNEVRMEFGVTKDRWKVQSLTELSTNLKDMPDDKGSDSLPKDEYSGNVLLDQSDNFH